MYQAPEQLIAFNKANFEAAVRFASIALESTGRLLEVQLKTAKDTFADGVQQAKAIAEVKDIQGFTQLKDSLTQPALEKAADYAKNVYDVASATQSEISALLEGQIAEFNKHAVTALDKFVKSAPAGSEVAVVAAKTSIAAVNSAYDNFTKATKQFIELTQVNVDTMVNQAKKSA